MTKYDPRSKIIKKYAKGRILDVGFRFGHLHGNLRQFCDDLWGIDNEYTGKEKNHFRGDATKMRFPARKFDVIVAGEIIEHFDNPKKLLKECRRVLKPNGILILSTPNKNSLLNRLFKNYEHKWHKTLFIEKTIKDLVKGHFKTIEVAYTPYTSGSTSDRSILVEIKSFLRIILNIFTPRGLKEDMILVLRKK